MTRPVSSTYALSLVLVSCVFISICGDIPCVSRIVIEPKACQSTGFCQILLLVIVSCQYNGTNELFYSLCFLRPCGLVNFRRHSITSTNGTCSTHPHVTLHASLAACKSCARFNRSRNTPIPRTRPRFLEVNSCMPFSVAQVAHPCR